MRSFEYFTPTRVVFGKDTHLKVATLLKEQHCKKVLIHYGGHSAIKSGLIDEIRSVLDVTALQIRKPMYGTFSSAPKLQKPVFQLV